MVERGFKRLSKETCNDEHVPKKSTFHFTSKYWILLVFLGSMLYLLNMIQFKSVNRYVWRSIYREDRTVDLLDEISSLQGYLVNTPGKCISANVILQYFQVVIKDY